MNSRRTVLQEKIIQTTAINETVGNESLVSVEIMKDTEKYYNATSVEERLREAERVQKATEKKAVEEKKAKEAAFKLLNITRHEEMLHKEKTAKFKEILDKYRQKEQAQKAKTREYLGAIDTLELLRYKARKTIGGWPAWVAARYYKIEAIPSGSCMFPAQCEGKQFNKTDTDIIKRVKFENSPGTNEFTQLGAWLRLYSLFGAFKNKDYSNDTSAVDPSKFTATSLTPGYTNGNIFQGATTTSAANTPVTIPGSQFLVAADFCPKEGPPGLPEMVDIMRLCEQIAYNRESRCCNKQDLTLATFIEEPLRRSYMEGDIKPWSDKKEKFVLADFLEDENRVQVTNKDTGDKVWRGKLSNKTMTEARNWLFNPKNPSGRHVEYKMTKFLVRQETDTMKDF